MLPYPWSEGSESRLACAAGPVPRTVEQAMERLRDHGSNPQAICRHGEAPTEQGNPPIDTLASLVMRPAIPRLQVAAGHPCANAFLDYAV